MRRKTTIKIIIAGLVLLPAAYAILYYHSDLLFKPPADVNSSSPPGEWAMFRHDLNHTGINGSSGGLPRGRLKWVFSTGGAVNSSPALLDTTIYVGSEDGRLYAVKAVTGERLWDFPTGDKITSSPTVADGIIYIGSHDGKLYVIM